MRLLTRAEELVLLAVWKLQNDACCASIRGLLVRMTGKDWSLGSIFDALDRLERKGRLRSGLAEPGIARGERSRRIYRVTREGKSALAEMARIQTAMWADTPWPETDGEEA
jgi:PadR family transcriptional regulator, regulatory protein PadR